MKKIILITTFLALSLTNSKIAKAQSIYGDFNNDGIVNYLDLDIIKNYNNKNDDKYDLNKDGVVDIYDISNVAKNIENEKFAVYNSLGKIVSEFKSGELSKAIENAYKEKNGTVRSNGKILWDRKNYWAFDGENFKKQFSNSYDAIVYSNNLSLGRVFSKEGQEIFNKHNNKKGIMAVTQDILNLRSKPDWDSRTDVNIPEGELVYIEKRTNSFYKTTWYKNNKEIYSGYLPYYLDFIQDDNEDSMLGYVAAKQESNMNPGAVSNNPNDKGGISVGVWQFSANAGSLGEFMTWLQSKNRIFYNKLNTAYNKDGEKFGNNFIEEWKSVANNNYDEFFNLQQEFAKKIFFDRFITISRKNGYEPGKLLDYVSTRNMIWSSAIHHGPTGAYRIFSKVNNNLSMEILIEEIYKERLNLMAQSYPPDSDNQGVVDIYNGIKKRFERESLEIKRCYEREISY